MITRLLLVLLIVGGVAVAALKQNAIAAARAEHQVLLGESEEARRLTEQNKDIARLRGEHEELEKLREANKDLPKLRNEMRQLRRQAEELAKLRAENQRLQAQQVVASGGQEALPPDFITRDALVDAGLGSPEAAAQTFFWAVSHGNIDRMAECMLGGIHQSAKLSESDRQNVLDAFKEFQGYRIAERNDISADEVVLMLQSQTGGGTMMMKFKQTGSGWKLEQ